MAATDTPQPMLALQQANRVRLARAELKRRVAQGETTVAEVVLHPPEFALTMPVLDILMSQHRWGRYRARRLLHGVPLRESKTLGELTDRQRRAVVYELGEQS